MNKNKTEFNQATGPEHISNGLITHDVLAKVAYILAFFAVLCVYIALYTDILIYHIFALQLLIITLPLILRTSGIDIDYQRKEIRLYTNFMFITFGRWQPIEEFVAVGIKKTVENHGLLYRRGRDARTSMRHLFIIDGANKKHHHVMSGDYDDVVSTMNVIKSEFDLPYRKIN